MGAAYRYFMLLKNREFDFEGAYTLDNFLKIMKEL